MKKKKPQCVVFTIGHSTRTLQEFIALLQQYHITHLIDIRTIPRSRHTPQFNEQHLHTALKKVRIQYTHLAVLGGLRHPQVNSVNTAWRNASFRGYADYMQTDSFKQGIEQLINYAQKKPVAIMCAEAVPWRCHRSLVGDALLAKGIAVDDIFSLTSCKPHRLTAWAKVRGGEVTYPGSSE